MVSYAPVADADAAIASTHQTGAVSRFAEVAGVAGMEDRAEGLVS